MTFLNADQFHQDIQSYLSTNSSEASVYREDATPKITEQEQQEGYIQWSVRIDEFDNCSEGFSNKVEGDLDITIYCRSRTTRYALVDDVQELFFPTVSGKRTFRPIDLGSTNIHYLYPLETPNLWGEKAGHPTPEIPGVQLSFSFKATI